MQWRIKKFKQSDKRKTNDESKNKTELSYLNAYTLYCQR